MTFAAYDAAGNVFGVVRSVTYAVGGNTVYTITGLRLDAADMQSFAETAGDTQATYAYLLSGNDPITGGSSFDSLMGYAGNDTLDGGAGPTQNSLWGGAGNDTYIVRSARDFVYESVFTNGGPTVDAGGVDSVISTASYTLPSYVENSTLAGVDGIGGKGNVLANVITGNSGANVLTGLGGNDRISGYDGNDTIVGGSQSDVLSGGRGSDVFDYDNTAESLPQAGAIDVIRDFTRGTESSPVDRIDLSTIDAIYQAGRTNDTFTFIGSAPFTAYGQVRCVYNAANDSLTVYANIGWDMRADLANSLPGVSALSTGNFIL